MNSMNVVRIVTLFYVHTSGKGRHVSSDKYEQKGAFVSEKEALYATLCDHIAAYSDYDLWFLDHAPETWQLIRTLDEWLLLYREDARVGLEQYRRNCERMQALYTAQERRGAA
jgi:hypothetical protein